MYLFTTRKIKIYIFMMLLFSKQYLAPTNYFIIRLYNIFIIIMYIFISIEKSSSAVVYNIFRLIFRFHIHIW